MVQYYLHSALESWDSHQESYEIALSISSLTDRWNHPQLNHAFIIICTGESYNVQFWAITEHDIILLRAGIPSWWEDSRSPGVPVPSNMGLRWQCGGRVDCLQWDHEEEGRRHPGSGWKPTDEDRSRRQGGWAKDNWAAPRVGEGKPVQVSPNSLLIVTVSAWDS